MYERGKRQKNFRSTPFSFFATRTGIIFTGALIGLIACLLTLLGNPVNMGVCVACFIRDIAGALGLHRAGVVQYLRPEIPAFVLGSCLAALTFGEFRARGGSSPVIRFVLGAFAMIGALVFLGCPWRAILRLAGGDLNAIAGLAGLAVGIAIGVWFLKKRIQPRPFAHIKKTGGLCWPNHYAMSADCGNRQTCISVIQHTGSRKHARPAADINLCRTADRLGRTAQPFLHYGRFSRPDFNA